MTSRLVALCVASVALCGGLLHPARAGDPSESLDRSWRHIERHKSDLGVRDVTGFCLEAAGRGLHLEHVQPALELVRKMQDRRAGSETYGNFRWKLGDDDVDDVNAVEFVVAQAVLAELRFGARLTPAARQILRDVLSTAASAVDAHRVPVSYTNMFLVQCWNRIALGQALAKADLAAAGYRALDEWIAYTRRYGVSEYSSPTYYAEDLDALGLIARLAAQPAGRAAATRALRYFWTEIAANWFQPGSRLGGAHSRTYDYLTAHGKLDAKLVRAGWFADPKMPDTVFDELSFWSPPRELHTMALATPRTVYQRWGEEPAQWASQYVGRSFSIGVAGATYGRQDTPLAVNLPGGPDTPIVGFFLDGRGDPYGHEPIRTGGGHDKSVHLVPLLASLQRGPEVLLLAADDNRTREATKTSKYLTCLLAHVILPSQAEVWVDDRRKTFSSSDDDEVQVSANSAVFVRTGDVALGIRIPLAVNTSGRPAKLLLADDGRKYGARRLTSELCGKRPKGQAYVAVWMRAAEGLDDAAFARFRRDFRSAQAKAQVSDPLASVEVAGQHGPMKLALDLAKAQRPISVGGDPHAADDVLVINGRSVAREILGAPSEKAKAGN